MLSLRLIVAPLAVAALLAVAAGASAGARATPTGTWAGVVSFFTVYGPGERYERARVTLAFKGRSATLVASGKSGASHDAASATATCTSVFRLVGAESGWLVYDQTSRTSFTGEGGVQNGPCTDRIGAMRGAVRVRPAGRRLKVEVGMRHRAEPPDWEYRAYVTRA